MRDLVWYCSYGSNISYDRFKLYLFGGASPLFDKTYFGCDEKVREHKSVSMEIPYELYFADEADFWEGLGIAFIKDEPNNTLKTYCRMYLITQDQFNDIVLQENGIYSNFEKNKIDFKSLKDNKYFMIGDNKEHKRYGKLLYINEYEGYPIITFTAKTSSLKINKPGEKYLKTIINGILENRDVDKTALIEYFKDLKGIKDFYNEKQLLKIIEDVIKNQPKQLVVDKTGKIKRNGEFFIQLDKNLINRPRPKYAVLKRKDRLTEIQAKIKYDKTKNTGEKCVKLDQQLRVTLAVDPGDEVLVFPMRRKYKHFIKHRDNFFKRVIYHIFGIQINHVRVRTAAYNDMEINVCRLHRESMDIIGIEPGEVIVIETPYNRVRTHAYEITETIKKEKAQFDNKVNIDCNKLLDVPGEDDKKLDINEILIDLDCRNELKIGQCAPVRIRRSIMYEIRKRLHYISTPLILTILTTIISFNLSDLTKLILISATVVTIIILTFINIRMKV